MKANLGPAMADAFQRPDEVHRATMSATEDMRRFSIGSRYVLVVGLLLALAACIFTYLAFFY